MVALRPSTMARGYESLARVRYSRLGLAVLAMLAEAFGGESSEAPSGEANGAWGKPGKPSVFGACWVRLQCALSLRYLLLRSFLFEVRQLDARGGGASRLVP